PGGIGGVVSPLSCLRISGGASAARTGSRCARRGPRGLRQGLDAFGNIPGPQLFQDLAAPRREQRGPRLGASARPARGLQDEWLCLGQWRGNASPAHRQSDGGAGTERSAIGAGSSAGDAFRRAAANLRLARRGRPELSGSRRCAAYLHWHRNESTVLRAPAAAGVHGRLDFAQSRLARHSHKAGVKPVNNDEKIKHTPETLAAYADGELEPRERVALDHWLADHPVARADVDAQGRLTAVWQATQPREPGESAWAAVLASIQSRIPVAAPVSPRRRLPLVWIAGLAAAVLAAVIFFATDRTSPSDSPFPAASHEDIVITSLADTDSDVLLVGEPPVPGPLAL